MKKNLLLKVCIIVLVSIFITGCGNKKVKLKIVSFDMSSAEGRVEETMKVKVGDVIDLKKYESNKIKILEINEKNVKFKWTKNIYDVDNNYKKSTVDVDQVVEYNKTFSINDYSPLAGAPMRYYSIKFIK